MLLIADLSQGRAGSRRTSARWTSARAGLRGSILISVLIKACGVNPHCRAAAARLRAYVAIPVPIRNTVLLWSNRMLGVIRGLGRLGSQRTEIEHPVFA